jgi:ACS family tartrate transporter-like MFS transporter
MSEPLSPAGTGKWTYRFRVARSSTRSLPSARKSPQCADQASPKVYDRTLLSKVDRRLLPLLLLSYIIAYIDRINVGFAKLHLREVLGVNEAVFNSVYGFGAGLFFIGYFLFEVPSNLILQRVGARIWIARIMIVWGLVSMAMMFIQSTAMFYTMRFLLGAAEAGFFPGVVLYLTYWYPEKERARTIALLAMGGVAAGVIGSPISGALLQLEGTSGLAGWQWLFLLEGFPAVLMGFIVLLLLPNRPRDARWLSPDEQAAIQGRLDEEAARLSSVQQHRLADVFRSGRVWLLCLIYFLLNIGSYGYELWLPSIIKSFSGVGDVVVGFINAVPYFIAMVVMFVIGRHSDRTGERRWHVACAAFASAAGFALSAYFATPILALAALAMAFAGLKSTIGPFWALATAFLSGTAAAGGIALINSVGNLGGFVGPYVVGLIKDRTQSNLTALLFLGAALLGMGLLVLTIRVREEREK